MKCNTSIHPHADIPLGGVSVQPVFKDFPDLVNMLECPPIGHFGKTIKHRGCSEYRRYNTSSL